MRIGAVIQARTSSTRLPEKVLKNLPYGSNITVLEQVIRRLKKSRMLNEIIIATTADEDDKKIIDIAKKENVKGFRGSKDNVLERYYLAAKKNDLNIVVRITSDCPCVDPEIVDLILESHLEENSDYTSNSLVKSFPHGLNVEVINFKALQKANFEAKNNFEKEHVTPFIYKTKPELFKLNLFEAENELKAPDIRITLDTEEDYALLCAVFDYLYSENTFFNSKDIINLFYQKPWLKLINKKIVQKRSFDTLEEEIDEAKKILDLQDLQRAKEILENHRIVRR